MSKLHQLPDGSVEPPIEPPMADEKYWPAPKSKRPRKTAADIKAAGDAKIEAHRAAIQRHEDAISVIMADRKERADRLRREAEELIAYVGERVRFMVH